MKRKQVKAGIGFIGVLTLIFTMIVFHEMIYGHPIFEHLSPSTVFMVFVYFIVGLAVKRERGICDMIDRILYISENGQTSQEKLSLIRSFIEINVNKWDQYWHLYEEIVKGQKITGRIKRVLMRVPRGSLSLGQFVWIFFYIIFNFLRTHMYFSFIIPDITFIIDFVGLGFFIITSSNVIGTDEFLKVLFESIRPDEKRDVEATLRLLESNIMFAAKQYGFMTQRCRQIIAEKDKLNNICKEKK